MDTQIFDYTYSGRNKVFSSSRLFLRVIHPKGDHGSPWGAENLENSPLLVALKSSYFYINLLKYYLKKAYFDEN